MTTQPTHDGEVHGRTERAARQLYTGIWRGLVDWFDVPDEPPTLPVRPGDEMRSFRPAEGFLKYLKLWFWIVCLLIDAGIFILWVVITIAVWWLGLILLPIALAIAILPDIVAYIALHLRFDTTWYVMTDRSLRIRRGVWTIHETTITFENVQNVKVTQGPLQRHFGIANLVVETAGSGGGQSQQGQSTTGPNVGRIEGVSNAEELRDRIMARLRLSTTAGLGDDDEPIRRGGFTPAHVAVLRDIRDEVTAMAG